MDIARSMLKSSSGERQSRRKSSGSTSRSSLVTVRPLEQSRSPPRSRLSTGSSTTRSSQNGPTVDTSASVPPKRMRSSSAKRPSSGQKLQASGGESRESMLSIRPSQSTNPTLLVDQERQGSFNGRPSLSGSAFGSYSGMTRRTPSPSKKRRPTDIPINRNHLAAPTGLMAKGGTAFPLESPLPTSNEPRTPLLFEEQIPAEDDTDISSYRKANPILGFRGTNFFGSSSFQSEEPSASSSRESNKPSLSSLVDSRNPLIVAGDRNFAWAPNGHMQSQGSTPELVEYRRDDDSDFPMDVESRSSPPRLRLRKDKDKKTMLANALQRANDAVQLDNSQNYTAAIEAYVEACECLTDVMNKSSSEEDKRKLRAIRSTYTDRIREIRQIETEHESSNESTFIESGGEGSIVNEIRPSLDASFVEDDSSSVLETAQMLRLRERENLISNPEGLDSRNLTFLPQAGLAPPRSDFYMPAPLSPRRPPPDPPREQSSSLRTLRSSGNHDGNEVQPSSNPLDAAPPASDGVNSSWLDSIEETVGSSPSSSHQSESSLRGFRRRHLRVHSSNTEAEFDAALDAAVEAAYDDGYEPYTETGGSWSRPRISSSASLHKNDTFLAGRADRALENLRQSSSHQSHRPTQSDGNDSSRGLDDDLDDDDRMLQEAQEYAADSLGQDSQTKTRFPRQSNSSSSSGRTWGSSAASSLVTAATSLSTVDEHAFIPPNAKYLSSMHPPPSAPPPTTALPLPPTRASVTSNVPHSGIPQHRPSLPTSQSSSSVQDRRLSGQKGKRLKIETAIGTRVESAKLKETDIPSRPTQPTVADVAVVPSKKAPGPLPSGVGTSQHNSEAVRVASGSSSQFSSPHPTPFQATFTLHADSAISPPTSSLTSALSNDSSVRPSPSSNSPGNPFSKTLNEKGLLKNNGSSLSLRNKGLLTPSADVYERSPGTPSSLNFSVTSPSSGHLSQGAASEGLAEVYTSGLRAQPRALEPCPEAQLLRPYWLMRCFYQTITHPDGGYLTTSLCIPRKVWQVANVKLKHVEDKVASCDLLSAALHKFGTIDTLDADAVLDEMEAFETVMAQVQTNLSRKLGNDVGPQNISSLFKEAPVTSPSTDNNTSRAGGTGEMAGNTNSSSSARSSSKSYFSSLRKLRGKASDTSLAKSYASAKEVPNPENGINTVPMTASLQPHTLRASKREGGLPGHAGQDFKTDGPNASYMGAVGKLCDAVQVLDQIARQVEDPGLKHSSPTHVGLELSSKHASEFFGLYICRFVLQDITMLAEKHVKRASEYVLG